MYETLIDAVHEEMEDLCAADTKELGEAIDMIKDLAEAMYYHTIVDSMKGTEPQAAEWHSYTTRKVYMEKKMHGDKSAQMQELEKYVQELTQELMEMVEGASVEEKQMLQRKLSMLASKIA
jgi:hypothetical protein